MPAWASYRRIFRALEAREDSLARRPGTIQADPLSPQRVDFGSEGFLEGRGLRYRLGYRFRILPLLLRTGREALRSYAAPPAGAATDPPRELFAELEAAARAQGVDAVGYTVLRPSDVFLGKAAPHPGVIVLVREMDAGAVSRAPSFEALRMIHASYLELGRAANRLTAYLRGRGHAAQAGPSLGGISVYPLLGARAGLGAVGRHGLLITPQFGSRQRLAVIYTGIRNLPVPRAEEADAHAWIGEFCDACRVCLDLCPGRAILPEPVSAGPGRRRYIDSARCLPQFFALDGCSWCIKECPFSRAPYESLKREFLGARRVRLY